MRVITGKYKGRHFAIPKTFRGRPTTDFAKENLFNVVRQYVDFEGITALDLFSGTGSISIELLSRGASRVVSIESNLNNFALLRQVQQTLSDPAWRPVHADALRIIQNPNQTFDLVFADPPYSLPQLPCLPQLILESTLLRPGGLLIVEHSKHTSFANHPLLIDHRAYGAVNFSLFRK